MHKLAKARGEQAGDLEFIFYGIGQERNDGSVSYRYAYWPVGTPACTPESVRTLRTKTAIPGYRVGTYPGS